MTIESGFGVSNTQINLRSSCFSFTWKRVRNWISRYKTFTGSQENEICPKLSLHIPLPQSLGNLWRTLEQTPQGLSGWVVLTQYGWAAELAVGDCCKSPWCRSETTGQVTNIYKRFYFVPDNSSPMTSSTYDKLMTSSHQVRVHPICLCVPMQVLDTKL